MNLFQIKDVAYVVSLHIKDSKTWLSFSLINKICAEVSHQRQSEVRKTLANHVWVLLKKNPNKDWRSYFRGVGHSKHDTFRVWTRKHENPTNAGRSAGYRIQ